VKRGGARRRRRERGPEDEFAARLRSVVQSKSEDEAIEERDAMVAMIVVRAIDRAKELTAVEGSGLAVRRALSAAEKPMAAFVERHLAKKRAARRRKA